MIWEELMQFIYDKFKYKNGIGKRDKEVADNKKVVKDFVYEQSKSKNITRKDIEAAIKVVNKKIDPSLSRGPIKLNELSKEEKLIRKHLHDKATEVIADHAYEYYERKSVIDDDKFIGVPRQIIATISQLSDSKEEAKVLFEHLDKYKNGAAEDKATHATEIKDFIVSKWPKMIKTLENFQNLKSDSELIDFYKENSMVIDTCAEYQKGVLTNIEKYLNIKFDDGLVENWDNHYQAFAQETIKARSKLAVMANPLYTEIDEKDAEIAYEYISAVDSNDYPTFKEVRKITKSHMEFGPHNFNQIGSLDRAAKIFGSVSAQLKFNNTPNQKRTYGIQMTNLEDHLNMVMHIKGVNSKLEDLTYIDKNGVSIQKNLAIFKMTVGEPVMIFDGSKYVMQAHSDPYRTYGFIDGTNPAFKHSDKAIALIEENKEKLKEIEKLKDKKKNAWFGFTRRKYQKQIDAKQKELNMFTAKLEEIRDEQLGGAIDNLSNKLNQCHLDGSDKQNDLFVKIRQDYLKLLTIDPNDNEKLKYQLEAIKKSGTQYLRNSLKDSNGLSQDENLRDKQIAVINAVDSLEHIEKTNDIYCNDINKYQMLFERNSAFELRGDTVTQIKVSQANDLSNQIDYHKELEKSNEKIRSIDDEKFF